MRFNHKPTDVLLRIAKAGLGFTLDTKYISAEALYQIAHAAAENGAHITVVDTRTPMPGETDSAFIADHPLQRIIPGDMPSVMRVAK